MENIWILLSVAAVWIFAAVSPGPIFLISVQTALSASRRESMFLVLGISLGTVTWGLAGFFGVTFVFNTAPWLFMAIKLLGGAYLTYLGIKILRNSSKNTPLDLPYKGKRLGARGAMARGYLTNLTNPKAPAFVGSLFLTVLPAEPPLWVGLCSVVIMTTLSASWYALTVWMFSTGWMAERYRRARKWIDRVTGAIFVGIGISFASLSRSTV